MRGDVGHSESSQLLSKRSGPLPLAFPPISNQRPTQQGAVCRSLPPQRALHQHKLTDLKLGGGQFHGNLAGDEAGDAEPGQGEMRVKRPLFPVEAEGFERELRLFVQIAKLSLDCSTIDDHHFRSVFRRQLAPSSKLQFKRGGNDGIAGGNDFSLPMLRNFSEEFQREVKIRGIDPFHRPTD